jgi:hypothetical protein
VATPRSVDELHTSDELWQLSVTLETAPAFLRRVASSDVSHCLALPPLHQPLGIRCIEPPILPSILERPAAVPCSGSSHPVSEIQSD